MYRRGRKILSLWPRGTSLKLNRRWTYKGHAERLRPGVYAWVVWPAYGTRAKPRFGRMLGLTSFRMVR
jgi:hypothetical protein